MEQRANRREDRIRKESRNVKHISRDHKKNHTPAIKSKWVTYDQVDSKDEEHKFLKTSHDHKHIRKPKNVNIKARKESKGIRKSSVSKPSSIPKACFYKCQFCGMILFNNRDIQTHDKHSKTFSTAFYKDKDTKTHHTSKKDS